MNSLRSTPLVALCIITIAVAAVACSIYSEADDAEYTVTYNSNGCNVAANNQTDIIKTFTYELHSSVKLKTYADLQSWSWSPTISNAAFLGWATMHNGPVVYPASDQPVYIQDISSDMNLYAVWGKVNVTVHQPTGYGSIEVKKYNETTFNKPAVTFQVVTCTELSFKFVPDNADTVNYWVINGEKRFYGQSEFSIDINGITEVSLFVNGQATDIYALSNGFQAVEYIENTTGAVIDTGINPDYKTRTEAVFETNVDSYNATSALFGARANWMRNTYAFWERTANATSMRSDYGVMSPNEMKILEYHQTYHVVKDGGYTTVTYADDGYASDTMQEIEFYTPSTMYIFCVAESSRVIGPSMPIKLYSFTIEENGITSRNYIPCVYKGESGIYYDSKGKAINNGEVGLYDTVYGIFYKNIGAAGTYFTAGPEVYTMGFNGDGGTGTQSMFTYSEIQDLNKKTVSVPVHPEGYLFCGYYLSEDPQTYSTMVFDTEGHYVNGSLTVSGSYVMIAKWQPVHVSYYENRDRQMSQDYLYQESYKPMTQKFTIPDAPSPPYSNYSFVCWSDSEENSYLPGEECYFKKDTVLYAIWKLETERTINYNYNDDLGRSFKIVEKETEVTIAAGPVREGYVFDHWNTSPDNTGISYQAGTRYTITDDMDLYAQWTYHIILVSNGGSGGTTELDFVGHIMPAITAPTKSGATFYGYSDSDGTMYYDSQGQSLTMWDQPTGTELFAMWSYTVTLNLGDCSFAETPAGWTEEDGKYTKEFIGYDSAYATVPLDIPAVPTGYIFMGWHSSTDHAATGGSINIFADTQFTAVYLGSTYTSTLTC